MTDKTRQSKAIDHQIHEVYADNRIHDRYAYRVFSDEDIDSTWVSLEDANERLKELRKLNFSKPL